MKAFALFMCVLALCAVPALAQTHADEAMYDEDMDAHEMTLWERVTSAVSGLSPLEIGSYTTSGAYSSTYYPGDTVVLKFDETSWNVACKDGAKFVIEVYDPTKFVVAKYDWVGPVSGNQHFAGTASYTLPSAPVGTYTFVDYLYCVDPASNMYLKTISSANKVSVTVREKAQTCSHGYIGEKICSDGDVKQLYRKDDCSSGLKVVQDCTSNQYCMSGACKNPECSSNSQCESWQECKSGQCVALPASSIPASSGSTGWSSSGTDTTSGSTSDETGDTSGDTSDGSDFEARKLIMPVILVIGGILASLFGLFYLGVPAFIIGIIWGVVVLL